MILAYLTPDTFLPISSAVAMIGGGLLAFWPMVKAFPRKAWRAVTGRGQLPPPPPEISGDSPAGSVPAGDPVQANPGA